MLAGAHQGETRDQCVWLRKARVALGPRFQRSSLSFQVPSEVAVVQCFDEEALGVAGPSAQLVGLEQALSPERRLPHTAVAEPDLRMGQRKIGIDSDRTLKKRQGTYVRAGSRFKSGAISLQRFA